ncbi:MAG TPA: hypothetical protein VIO94_06970 [Phenylobacterium sp.]
MVALAAVGQVASAEPATVVQQLGGGGPVDARTTQISEAGGEEGLPQIAQPPTSATAQGQLSAREPIIVAPAQVAPSRPRGEQSPQLQTGPRTAAGPAALSTPAQGRATGVEVVKGQDRCDPRVRRGPADADDCRAVIETRSAEFSRPVPAAPSAEESLMIFMEQDARPDARVAARRLAEGDVDGSMAAQALAASARQESPQSAPSREPEPQLSPAAQALLDAMSHVYVAPGGGAR